MADQNIARTRKLKEITEALGKKFEYIDVRPNNMKKINKMSLKNPDTLYYYQKRIGNAHLFKYDSGEAFLVNGLNHQVGSCPCQSLPDEISKYIATFFMVGTHCSKCGWKEGDPERCKINHHLIRCLSCGAYNCCCCWCSEPTDLFDSGVKCPGCLKRCSEFPH